MMGKLSGVLMNLPTFYIACIVVVNLVYFNMINTSISEESELNEKEICRNFGRDGIVTKDGWIPRDCKLFNYSDSDIRHCLKIRGRERNSKIVFYGDSRMRHLYVQLVNVVSNPKLPFKGYQRDFKYINDSAKLEAHLKWDTYFDLKTRNRYKDIMKPENLESLPDMVLVCIAMWPITFPGKETYADHVRNATLATNILKRVAKLTRVFYVSAEFTKRGHTATKDKILKYNNLTRRLLKNSDVMMMDSAFELAKTRFHNYFDRAHPGYDVLNHKLQMMFNNYCNSVMHLKKDYCCSAVKDYEPRGGHKRGCLGLCKIKQILEKENVIFYVVIFNCCSVMLLFILIKRRMNKPLDADVVPHNIYDAFIYTTQYSAILMFIYLADRTTIFKRADKCFSFSTFTGPLLLLFTVGCFLTKESKDATTMNRNITEEMKGWMQLMILFYHMSGASSILPIYSHIRVVVSAYIFLTGYGHFVYYWKGGSLGLKRYAMVMFRMNFLVVSLCILMNQSYQHYYFVPLISFWYTVACLIMWLPPWRFPSKQRSSTDYRIMAVKILLLFIVLTTTNHLKNRSSEFLNFKRINGLDITTMVNTKEWWFRWKLDRFSLVYGLTYGALCMYATDEETRLNRFFAKLNEHRLKYLVLVCVAVGMMGIYEYLANLCFNKFIYNSLHPYLTWMPILSYLILRNLSERLRSNYSWLMSWFGKISLELFVCQYHLWLADDTHRVLQLIPHHPNISLILGFTILVIISKTMNSITTVLTKFIFK